MKRVATITLLLIAMLWQSVGMTRAGAWSPVSDLVHTVMHWQNEGHHHHDDGTYHVDDSTESVQHLIADHSSATVGLLTSAPTELPVMRSASPDVRLERPGPSPFLGGPLRPPRLTA
jgi:hypothetical protein